MVESDGNGMIEKKLQAEGGSSRNLPSDVVGCILRRLPARSVARLRCVCKQWRSLTHDHRFIHEHCRHAASERHNLLGSRRPARKGLRLYRFGPNQDIFKLRSLPNPDELRCDALSNPVNGLIAAFCVSTSSESESYHPDSTPDLQPYLINPITRDHSPVPGGIFPAVGGRPWPQLGLGFDASRGAYKLVCWLSSSCMVLTVGADGAWRRVEGHAPFEGFGYSPPVFIDGAVYWLATTSDHGCSLLAFDVKDEELRLVPMPDTPASCLRLQDFEGRLCFVKYSVDNGSPVARVWKLEGQPGQQHWMLQHVICPFKWLGILGSAGRRSIPSLTTLGTDAPWVVDIRGGKEVILLRFGAIWYYDLRAKAIMLSAPKPCSSSADVRCFPLAVIAETLVSPTILMHGMPDNTGKSREILTVMSKKSRHE